LVWRDLVQLGETELTWTRNSSFTV